MDRRVFAFSMVFGIYAGLEVLHGCLICIKTKKFVRDLSKKFHAYKGYSS